MNKLFLLTTVTACVCATAHAESACERLPLPELNYSADMELAKVVEMQTSVKEFVASGEAYLKCIDGEKAKAGEEASDEQRGEWLALYNAAVDDMKTTADRFNGIVREYKSAHPK